MNAPHIGDDHARAPASGRRQKRNPLRRHWLSGALIFGVVGLAAYTGMQLYQADIKLQQVRATRAQLEARLQEERLRNQTLVTHLAQVTSDPYMELLAREMGFIYPGETIYQKGTGKEP